MPPNERVEYVLHDYDGKAQKFWSNYVSEAAKHDKHLTENWKGNMDSALIFAGLFSAVVSTFIIESYKLLQEDSSDVTNALLIQILASQMATISSNSSSIPVIPTVTPPMKFVPSTSAITINILWFLSLVFSLAAAFIMILIQQWIRDYLQRIERNSDPLRRARDRIFLSNGMERWWMDVVVHYIPTLLHISLFLFLSGIYIFLARINRTVTLAVIPIILCCAVLYGLITLSPLIDPSSPYETSFSSLFWRILQYTFQSRRTWLPSPYLQRARNQLALNPLHYPHATDAGAFVWLYNRISNDKELQIFLESLPEFVNSWDGRRTFSLEMHNDTIRVLLRKLISLANRHSNSTLGQRAVACIEALSPILVSTSPKLLPQLLQYCSRLCTASISDNATLPMICFRVLTIRHHYSLSLVRDYPFGLTQEICTSSIHDIDDMRRVLGDVVASHEGDSQHLNDIQDLVEIYCATLNSKSAELRRWSNSLKTLLGIKSLREFSSSLRWFHELHSARLEFSCDTPAMVPGVGWDEVFHGPRLLAFMRATGALEPLPHIPESSLTSPRQPPEPGITSNRDLETHFLREIHPLLTLLDVAGAKYQIRVTGEASKYERVLQLVLRVFGPFDTARFILDDWFKESRVIALLELVVHLMQRPDLIVEDLKSKETSVFRQTIDKLDIVEDDGLHGSLPACSEHLFVGVLYALLTLEHEAMSNSKQFVLPRSEMKHLISFIQYFQDSDALQIAQNLLPITCGTSKVSVIQDNRSVRHPPPNLQQTREQWKALHDRVVNMDDIPI